MRITMHLLFQMQAAADRAAANGSSVKKIDSASRPTAAASSS